MVKTDILIRNYLIHNRISPVGYVILPNKSVQTNLYNT